MRIGGEILRTRISWYNVINSVAHTLLGGIVIEDDLT
jgi:hypothetical protein